MKNIKTSIKVKMPNSGKSIEENIRGIMTQKAPIEKSVEMIYTERKNGVLPEHDIRTDRFDIACQAHDKHAKASIAKRQSEDNPKPETTETTETTDTKNN